MTDVSGQPPVGAAAVSAARELFVGAAAGALTESTFYALDSAKIQSQLKAGGSPRDAFGSSAPRALQGVLLLRGIVPTVIFGSVPSFGTFFVLYVPLKSMLDSSTAPGSSGFWPTLLASATAAVPSSLISVPSDVLKKVVFSDSSLTYRSALRQLSNKGISPFFKGW